MLEGVHLFLAEILKKLVHTGLANCTRNIEKASKNRVCWRTDILKTLLRTKNWARFSEYSAFFHKKALYIVNYPQNNAYFALKTRLKIGHSVFQKKIVMPV